MAIEKGPGTEFTAEVFFKHRAMGGQFWIGIGLREDTTDDLRLISHWFGQMWLVADSNDWEDQHVLISGAFPSGLQLDKGIDICKVAAPNGPPFSKDTVYDFAWDTDRYIEKHASFNMEKPDSTFR